MAIEILSNLHIQNDFSQELCLSLEKNNWQVTDNNGSWHNEKECTHDKIIPGKQWNDDGEIFLKNVTLCKSVPFARGDSYISCTYGQSLESIPKFDEDQSVRVLIAFAKQGVTIVSFVLNVFAGIFDYLDKPESFKAIPTGVSQDLVDPLDRLATKAQVISKIEQALSSLVK